MRDLFIILASIFLLSCNSTADKKHPSLLKQWIIDNQAHLENDIDTSIKNYIKVTGDSTHSTVTLVTTMNARNSLGTLAKIAGDSTGCIVVELTFYKDRTRKRKILIAAEDSSCLNKLNSIEIENDSIGNLLFGKNPAPIYGNDGYPLN